MGPELTRLHLVSVRHLRHLTMQPDGSGRSHTPLSPHSWTPALGPDVAVVEVLVFVVEFAYVYIILFSCDSGMTMSNYLTTFYGTIAENGEQFCPCLVLTLPFLRF